MKSRHWITAYEDRRRSWLEDAEIFDHVFVIAPPMKIVSIGLIVSGKSPLEGRATCFGIVDVNDAMFGKVEATFNVHV